MSVNNYIGDSYSAQELIEDVKYLYLECNLSWTFDYQAQNTLRLSFEVTWSHFGVLTLTGDAEVDIFGRSGYRTRVLVVEALDVCRDYLN